MSPRFYYNVAARMLLQGEGATLFSAPNYQGQQPDDPCVR
jgi:hypothetical protein